MPLSSFTERYLLRALRSVLVGAWTLGTLLSCVFGPEPVGIVNVDHPPYIDPEAVLPKLSEEPAVVFNLSESDRSRSFQVLGVYDWDPGDVLTYAFVLRIGTDVLISIPDASVSRLRLRVSSDQTTPYATRYESSQLTLDPCTYRDVVDGIARHGSVQIVVYDTIDTTPSIEGFEGQEYSVRWTWPLEFQGQCPLCADDSQCFEDERCVGGVCTPN